MREVSGDSKGFGLVYLRGIGTRDEVLKELMNEMKGLMVSPVGLGKRNGWEV
jgi:hypothetical protein